MKRLVIALCVVSLLALPVLAVEPLTDYEMSSAIYDVDRNAFLYDGKWYDGDGYPLYVPQAPVSEIENNISSTDKPDTTSEAVDNESDAVGESETDSDDMPATLPDDTTLVHQEDTSGNTQVNVFAIQTDDETGGAWIQGGSGESLTEKLFGEYTPYNASGIASVDWAWIADVVLFAILVICFFKIVAGVMKRV